MTSMPASRSARAMIFAPRSCPSSPGLATTTRILRFEEASMASGSYPDTSGRGAAELLYQFVDGDQAHVAAGLVARHDRVEAVLRRACHPALGHWRDGLA